MLNFNQDHLQERRHVTHMETHMCLYGAGAGQLYCYNKATISLNLKRGVAWNFHHFLQWYYLCQERVENLWDIRPSGQRVSVCLPSLTYKNIGTLTWGHVWTHKHTHSSPCFITSCLLLELLSSLEWSRQSRLYCVNLFVCQERLQRSLSLFVFGRGDRERERGRGRESDGGIGWGGTQEPG